MNSPSLMTLPEFKIEPGSAAASFVMRRDGIIIGVGDTPEAARQDAENHGRITSGIGANRLRLARQLRKFVADYQRPWLWPGLKFQLQWALASHTPETVTRDYDKRVVTDYAAGVKILLMLDRGPVHGTPYRPVVPFVTMHKALGLIIAAGQPEDAAFAEQILREMIPLQWAVMDTRSKDTMAAVISLRKRIADYTNSIFDRIPFSRCLKYESTAKKAARRKKDQSGE